MILENIFEKEEGHNYEIRYRRFTKCWQEYIV